MAEAFQRVLCLATASTLLLHGAVGCCAHHAHAQVVSRDDCRPTLLRTGHRGCACRGHTGTHSVPESGTKSSSEQRPPAGPERGMCHEDRCVTLLTDGAALPDAPPALWAAPAIVTPVVAAACHGDAPLGVPHLRANLLVHVLLI